VPTAVVVGAGVGGLAAAGGLARSGWQVTLVERADRLRGSGVALVIWPNGAAALRTLDLSLGDITFPMLSGGIRRPDGRWLVESVAITSSAEPSAGSSSSAEPAQAPVVVHADDLHDALMAGLGDKIEIRTGTEIVSVRAGTAERPAVHTSKHRFEADLIVAADGARSVIRNRLFPTSAVTSVGYTAWRAVIPWYRAPKLADGVPAAGDMLGEGQRFVHATLGERGSSGGSTRGGIYWMATVPGALRPEAAPTQLSLLRRWFTDWRSPVGELLDATEPDDLVQQAGEELRPLPSRFGVPVGSGGFVLLGDAAHVANPNLAQGACLAFEDAATLRSVLRGVVAGQGLARSLEEYTQLRLARVARVARTSRRLGWLTQARGRLAVTARDVVLNRFPQVLDRAATSVSMWSPDL
jgi:2-polyprenyl-6-methoxyphenol hydroxylase-like FAD-dependent oxidoreductase